MAKAKKAVAPRERAYRVRAIDSENGIRLVRTWHRPKYVIILIVAATATAMLGIVSLLWIFESSNHNLLALAIILIDLIIVAMVTYHAFASISNQTVVDVTPTGVSVVHSPVPWPGAGFYPVDQIAQVTLFAGKHTFKLRLLLKSKKIIQLIDDLGTFQQAQFIQFQVARHLGMVKIKSQMPEQEEEEEEASEAA
jgi:hypothetical protein